jgi:hypothetical protein
MCPGFLSREVYQYVYPLNERLIAFDFCKIWLSLPSSNTFWLPMRRFARAFRFLLQARDSA